MDLVKEIKLDNPM